MIKTRRLVVLDGGGLITLSGGGKRRILYSDTCAGTWSTDDCVDQPYPQIVVQNITFEDGYDGAHQATCTANVPTCWYGGVDGGGAIYVEGGQFRAVNSRFLDNGCYAVRSRSRRRRRSALWPSTKTAPCTSPTTRSAAAAAPTAGH